MDSVNPVPRHHHHGEQALPGKSDHIIDRLPGVLDSPQAARLLLPQVLHHELLEGCFQTLGFKKGVKTLLLFLTKYNSEKEPAAVCLGFS